MAVGIIAEYNPFHAGHAYQIARIKNFSDAEIVAVMSGSFTQRGEPAILDKWTRARLAIANGVDLVFELPFVSAVRSAQDFARGGIRLLESLGVVDTLAFGAEVADLSALKLAAATFDEKFFADELHALMSQGISYAAAVTKILSKVTTLDEKILRQPNTILAIEYLRALPKKISPLLIERRGAAYDDLNLHEEFSSASAIRKAIRQPSPPWQKIQVDAETLTVLRDEKISGLVDEKFLFRPLMTKLLTSTAANLRKIYGMTEGLEFRLLNAAMQLGIRNEELGIKDANSFHISNFKFLIDFLVGRRFTESRIRRLILHTLLDVTGELIAELDGATCARVLAFNERGRQLLKKISVPVVTKVTKHLNRRDLTERTRILTPPQKILLLDVLATDLRAMLFDSPKLLRKDFSTPPKFGAAKDGGSSPTHLRDANTVGDTA